MPCQICCSITAITIRDARPSSVSKSIHFQLSDRKVNPIGKGRNRLDYRLVLAWHQSNWWTHFNHTENRTIASNWVWAGFWWLCSFENSSLQEDWNDTLHGCIVFKFHFVQSTARHLVCSPPPCLSSSLPSSSSYRYKNEESAFSTEILLCLHCHNFNYEFPYKHNRQHSIDRSLTGWFGQMNGRLWPNQRMNERVNKRRPSISVFVARWISFLIWNTCFFFGWKRC